MLSSAEKTTRDILLWKSNQLQMLLEISNTLAITHDLKELFQKIVDSAAKIMNLGSAAIYLLNNEGMLNLKATFPVLPDNFPESMKKTLLSNHAHVSKVISTKKSIIVPDVLAAQLTEEELAVAMSRNLHSMLYIPLCNQGRAIGVLIIGSIAQIHRFTNDEVEICHALANQAALEIERTILAHEKQAHINQIEEHILRQEQIEASLYASEQRYRHLAENALDIIYRLQVTTDSNQYRVEYISPSVKTITGYGQEKFIENFSFILDLIHPSDLAILKNDDQKFYQIEPLTIRIKSKAGKLVWLEHRIAPLYDKRGNLLALEGIARDITERKHAEQKLHHAYEELNHAYEATIESLTRGLELRDYETKGHCRRVVDLTMRLAKAMEIPENELTPIQRGALLHDIGKMGISDAILLKPGPLTEEEWEIMRQHPQLAYDMLYPIKYLRPALIIPLHHHEKYDGTGYPCGLKGEKIPLAARIFAIVDVYDALISDRPYRKAWTKEAAIQHIKEQSGHHFDPKVVKTFLKLI